MHSRDREPWITTHNLKTYGWNLYRGKTALANFGESHTQERSATAHISSCNSPNAYNCNKPLMGKKYGLNFRLQGAWTSCTVRISVCYLLQRLSVVLQIQGHSLQLSTPPPLFLGMPQYSLFIDWDSFSCSTRENLIKAASFDNTFHSSLPSKRKHMVLNVLNQVVVDRKWENY